MYKLLIFLLFVLLSCHLVNSVKIEDNSKAVKEATEFRTRIAIVDSGLNASEEIKPFLCNVDSISYIDSNPMKDELGHGTNISNLIVKPLDSKKACIVMIKIFSNEPTGLSMVSDAVEYAIKIKADFLNLSLYGQSEMAPEKFSLRKALEQKMKISVAAGNDRSNLDIKCDSFPACYSNEFKSDDYHVVGSDTRRKNKNPYSNYGDVVKYWEDGTEKGNPPYTGSSQATAIHTGKWAAGLIK